MSSFSAEFDFGSGPYRVLNCHYGFNQDVNRDGKPASGVRGGTVFVEVEAPEDSGQFKPLIEWMVNPTKRTTGKVRFYKTDEENAKLKDLEFNDAYCVEYSEKFTAYGSEPYTIGMTISAKKIKVGDAELDNLWK